MSLDVDFVIDACDKCGRPAQSVAEFNYLGPMYAAARKWPGARVTMWR